MRLPIIPTVLVAAAVATMIGLGVWQLQRGEWKTALIAQAERQPPRLVTLSCQVSEPPEVRAGRSRAGDIGYRFLASCRPVIDHRPLMIDVGWSANPRSLATVALSGRTAGWAEPGDTGIVVLRDPLPPLGPSALPRATDLPNNHRLYAAQWFFFAAAASVIYVLALRRRQKVKLQT